MTVPNTFLIGAQKAGTTFLYSLLTQHPDVAGGTRKEPGYFTLNRDRGTDWYAAHYAGIAGAHIVIDASTTYSDVSLYPETPRLIAQLAPAARIIYVLRHPLERIESSWMQARDSGIRVSPDFNRAVRDYPPLMTSTRYGTNLAGFRDHFDDSQIRVELFDELVTQPGRVVDGLFGFLGVDPAAVELDIDTARRNPSSQKMEDGSLLYAARSIPGNEALRDLIPRSLRSVLRSALKRPFVGRPRWDLATHAWVCEQLAPEAEEALRYAGRDPSHWDLSLPS